MQLAHISGKGCSACGRAIHIATSHSSSTSHHTELHSHQFEAAGQATQGSVQTQRDYIRCDPWPRGGSGAHSTDPLVGPSRYPLAWEARFYPWPAFCTITLEFVAVTFIISVLSPFMRTVSWVTLATSEPSWWWSSSNLCWSSLVSSCAWSAPRACAAERPFGRLNRLRVWRTCRCACAQVL
jgi:hypothetical protein